MTRPKCWVLFSHGLCSNHDCYSAGLSDLCQFTQAPINPIIKWMNICNLLTIAHLWHLTSAQKVATIISVIIIIIITITVEEVRNLLAGKGQNQDLNSHPSDP